MRLFSVIRSFALALGAVAACVGATGAQAPTGGRTPAERQIDSLSRAMGTARSAAVRSAAASQLAEALRIAGHDAQVLPTHRTALALAHASGDTTVLAQALHGLGVEHWRRRQFDSALVHLEYARALRMLRADSSALGRVLNSVGSSYYQLGIYEEALDAFTQAVDIRRAQRDSLGVARSLTNIGKTYHDWGQYDRARRVFDEAVEIAARIDSQVPLGYALNSLASLSIDRGDLRHAREQLQQSRAAYQRASPHFTRSDSTSVWTLSSDVEAKLLLSENRVSEAIVLLDSLRKVASAMKDDGELARALRLLGDAYQRQGNTTKARDALANALAASQRVRIRMLTLEILRQRADVEEAAGQSAAALHYLRASQALRDTVFNQTAANRIAAMESRSAIERQLRENVQLRRSITIGSSILLGAAILLAIVGYYHRQANAQTARVERANEELRAALSEVRALKGLIPICAWCKKVRDDAGYWESVESYVAARSEASFSHGICQSCAGTVFGDETTDPLTALERAAPPAPGRTDAG